MIFAHDTEATLVAAAALVNTTGSTSDRAGGSPDGDRLPDIGALDDLVQTYGWNGRCERTRAELQAVRALRPRLRRLWEMEEDEVVKTVNALLRESNALPQLVRHDEWPYHLHVTASHAPLATRMAVETAMAFVDVVRSGELGRLRICDYPGCANVVVDLTKNRCRRFCDAGCGNRAAVEAYRARKAAARG